MIKRAGVQKEYLETDNTFTKLGMWPERYRTEVLALQLVATGGISVPTVISHGKDKYGNGYIELQRINAPRADQIIWNKPNFGLIKEMGRILAKIHQIQVSGWVDLSLARRRFYDLSRDIENKSRLPLSVYCAGKSVFSRILAEMEEDRPCLIHGDYTFQNIFSQEPLVVFDWEHSCVCSGLYDIGTFLSFMILPVTDGYWNFSDYFEAQDSFIFGYTEVCPEIKTKMSIIDALRYLGHRQVPQYYLFVLEYEAFVNSNWLCLEILQGNIKSAEDWRYLEKQGLVFEPVWFAKIIRALASGGYHLSTGLRNLFREGK